MRIATRTRTRKKGPETKPVFEVENWPASFGQMMDRFTLASALAAQRKGWILRAMAGPIEAEECWYIAGPMRGYNLWNFPAFDRRRNQIVARGNRVVSPADLDRVRGFTEHMTEFPPGAFAEAMAVDITAIMNHCTGIDLLPGWSQSTGARYEWCVAEALGKKISYAPGAERMVLAITPVDVKVGTGVTD